MTRLKTDRGIHVKSPRVQTTADDAYKILNNLYNFLCDAEQIVVGCYTQFSKTKGKDAAEKLLANNSTQSLHKLKLYKNDLNVLTSDTKKLFENAAKIEGERSFSFKKNHRKDDKIDQQILSTPEEKIVNTLLNLSETMVAKRKQIIQDISYLQSYSWKDENSKIFKDECENLSKNSLTVVEQFTTTYNHAKNVVEEKHLN